VAGLLDHLWQSTLLAAAAALIALVLGNAPARVRCWIWFAAMAKFLVPFALLTWGSAWLAAHLHAQAPEPARLRLAREMLAPIAAPAAARALPRLGAAAPDLRPALWTIWALGSAGILAWRAAQWRRLQAALAGAVPVSLPTPLSAMEAGRDGPAVVGVLRPVLLLPPGLAGQLTPAELEAVLEHELHHVRRRDNLLTLPLLAVQALFWFHPMVWWVGRRLLAERERACDEAVVDGGVDAEPYARGLLQVCRFQVAPPPAWAAAMTGANLQRRIRRIMANDAARPLGVAGGVVLATAAAAALAGPMLAGVFVAPIAAPLLARLAQALPDALPSPAAPPVAVRATTSPAPAPAEKIVLRAQTAVLTPAAVPEPGGEPMRLSRRPATPSFEPTPVAALADPPPAPAGAAPAALVQALASKTAYVLDDSLWSGRIELRRADACPAAQVARAQRALGGEAISTAFDGEVRHFVDDLLAGRPAAQDLSPTMARAVDARLPALQPALARSFAAPGRTSLLGEDTSGRDVYLVRRGDRESYVLVLVDDLGQIEAALFCAAG